MNEEGVRRLCFGCDDDISAAADHPLNYKESIHVPDDLLHLHIYSSVWGEHIEKNQYVVELHFWHYNNSLYQTINMIKCW